MVTRPTANPTRSRPQGQSAAAGRELRSELLHHPVESPKRPVAPFAISGLRPDNAAMAGGSTPSGNTPGRHPDARASQRSAPAESPAATGTVLVMNHNRDDLSELCAAMARSGQTVQLADSLAQSKRLLSQTRPDVVILNPLVLCAEGVELELLEGLQQEDDPVPVILLVDDLGALAEARHQRIPFQSFVLRPYSTQECVQRLTNALEVRRAFRNLQARAQKLESQVSIDFKTGLISELYLKRLLTLEWKRAQRHQTPLSLLLIDVDNFKGVNDSTEYAFGDEVLRRVAEALKGNIRETDFAGRFGGDEFCVLLPHTSPAEAVQTALRIRQRISGMLVQSGNYQRQVTVSIGVDSYDGRSAGSTDNLRRNANRALQEAKRRGKNQVWLYSGQEPEAVNLPAAESGR